jgi:hypothetical protein
VGYFLPAEEKIYAVLYKITQDTEINAWGLSNA